MLRITRLRIIVTSAVLLIAVACGNKHHVETIEQQKIEPSFPQSLIVKNESQNPVTIIPVSGSQARPIMITPDGSEQLQFTVVRMAQLDEAGNPVATTRTVMINEENPYIEMQNTDGLIQIKTVNGETWNYLISLGECWFDNNPPTEEHEIDVGDESPALGIPVLRLCE